MEEAYLRRSPSAALIAEHDGGKILQSSNPEETDWIHHELIASLRRDKHKLG